MHDDASKPAQPAIPLAEALRFWLKLGFVSFGGPAGQIALMHRELVQERRWISAGRFAHALNYCMLLPGPEAQQLATYLGWLMHRTWGGIAAGVLFVLPSLFILMALAWVYLAHGNTTLVGGLFDGVKPAVAALVLHAVWRIGRTTLDVPTRRPLAWALAVTSFAAMTWTPVGFPWIVALAAGVGWLATRWGARSFVAGTGHGAHQGEGSATAPAALIDDHTPVPDHARFAPRRLGAVIAVGLALWAVPLALITAFWGWGHTLSQMGWFFTKAALVTFGGAYAVLPYVVQGAVEQHQWLTAPQMMAGLALGETTPGPLIMVVAFVGFVGGHTHDVLGPHAPWLGAMLAAWVATWFTFLPSFVFILAGGPLVEATHGKLGFTAPLAAITAAVVGVIATLAVLFVSLVLWPGTGHGSWAAVNAPGVLIGAAALLALTRFKRGAIEVIAACALTGLLLRFL
jgi:chromate transporter